MQAQGLPVPTPGAGGGGATPAVAAAAQQVAAARATQLQGQQGAVQPRAAPSKARRSRAPPAGSVVSADAAVPASTRRTSSQQLAPKARGPAGTARHAQQQQQQPPPQQQHASLQQQQYAAAMLRRQQAAFQHQQWATGGLAAPDTPQQMHFDSPALQQLVEVEVAQPFGLGHGGQGRGRAHGHGHGQLAHHSGLALHASQQGGYAGQGGNLEPHTMHGVGQLVPASLAPQLDAAAGPSHQGSPVAAGSSGGAPTGSTGSDWEALLRMDHLPSPQLLATSRHGSLMRLAGGGGGSKHAGAMQQYGSAGALAVHPSAAVPQPLATHPTAPASLWDATAGTDGWPGLGGPAGVPQQHMPAQHAVTVLVSPARHRAPPPPAANHTSDSDSDHYADLGDLLDMPALLAGGVDAFDALAAGLGSPSNGTVSGGLPGHRTAASSWAIDTSPFF